MGVFDLFKNGLSKTRKSFGEQWNRVSASFGIFDEEALEELEEALILADVGMPATTYLVEKVRNHITQTGRTSREEVMDILNLEMQKLLGDAKEFTWVKGELNVVLLVGVNGTGKTTTCGKIACKNIAEGKKVMLAAADTFRAAAVSQLRVWAERNAIQMISHDAGADPAAVVYDAVMAAKARKVDLLLVDTAGRLHNKQNLMAELAKIKRVVEREVDSNHISTLLVIDATSGQNAIIQANAFHEATHIDAMVLTKLDGNAKGGIALAVTTETKLPLAYVGLGEKIDELQAFAPAMFVEALLPR